MTSKIIDKLFSTYCLLAIIIISDMCNLKDFFYGANSEINPLTLTITIIYTLYCSVFAFLSHTPKNIRISIFLGIITLILAIFGVLASAFSIYTTTGLILPFVIVFLSPFQGLSAVLSANWSIIYTIIILLSILWILFGILNFKRYNKSIHTPSQKIKS